MNGLASYFWIAVAAILLLIDLWARERIQERQDGCGQGRLGSADRSVTACWTGHLGRCWPARHQARLWAHF